MEFERKSYRTTFSGRLREQIQRAWQEYADEAVFAEPLSAAEDKVTNVKKGLAAASRIARQELMGGADAAVFVRHIIQKHLPALPAGRLAFCTVTQDCDDEGVLRLHQLPTAGQAAASGLPSISRSAGGPSEVLERLKSFAFASGPRSEASK